MTREIDPNLYFEKEYIGKDVEDYELAVSERWLTGGGVEYAGRLTFKRADGDVVAVTFPLHGDFGQLILSNRLSEQLISLLQKHGPFGSDDVH